MQRVYETDFKKGNTMKTPEQKSTFNYKSFKMLPWNTHYKTQEEHFLASLSLSPYARYFFIQMVVQKFKEDNNKEGITLGNSILEMLCQEINITFFQYQIIKRSAVLSGWLEELAAAKFIELE